MKIIRAILLFIVIWLFIPWVVKLSLEGLGLNYPFDYGIVNELILLLCSLVVIALDYRTQYDFSIDSRYLVKIVFWTSLLQSLTVIGLVLSVIYFLPLPDFVYHDSALKVFTKFVILVPFCEEVFLRGLIQTKLSLKGSVNFRHVRLTYSVILAALLFATMHVFPFRDSSLKDFLSTFVLGLIAGYYRERTGSLFSAFVAHSTYNFWGGFVAKIIYLIGG